MRTEPSAGDRHDEEAVRAMLRRRAADVRPSPAAWDAIAARLDEPADATVVPFRPRPAAPRRRVVAGAAAAAVAAATFGGVALLGSGPTSLVADAPDGAAPATAVAPEGGTPLAGVWPRPTAEALQELSVLDPRLLDPREAAVAYLTERLAPGGEDVGLEVSDFQDGDADSGEVTYGTEGGAGGQVLLRRVGGEGTPWYVVAAASELLTYDQVVQDGDAVLRVTSELGGTMSYEVRDASGEVVLRGEEPVAPRATVVLGALESEGAVTVRATTSEPGGPVTAFLEVWAEPNPSGPGDLLDDDFPGVHPVTGQEELVALQARVDAGEAVADAPAELAASLLGDLGVEQVEVGAFRQGDALSGEVPFTTGGGGRGTVLVRRLTEGGVWFATAVTSDDVEVVAVRPEDGTLVVDVTTSGPGTLSGEAGAPGDTGGVAAVPQRLDRGMTTSLGFPGVAGPAIVVVRFEADGGGTSVAVTRP